MYTYSNVKYSDQLWKQPQEFFSPLALMVWRFFRVGKLHPKCETDRFQVGGFCICHGYLNCLLDQLGVILNSQADITMHPKDHLVGNVGLYILHRFALVQALDYFVPKRQIVGVCSVLGNYGQECRLINENLFFVYRDLSFFQLFSVVMRCLG